MAGVPKPFRIVDSALLECVRGLACVACDYAGPVDPAHVLSRGAGGGDEDFNVMPLCRLCHRLQHHYGFKGLIEKYPSVWIWLKARGWHLDEHNRLWRVA